MAGRGGLGATVFGIAFPELLVAVGIFEIALALQCVSAATRAFQSLSRQSDTLSTQRVPDDRSEATAEACRIG